MGNDREDLELISGVRDWILCELWEDRLSSIGVFNLLSKENEQEDTDEDVAEEDETSGSSLG